MLEFVEEGYVLCLPLRNLHLRVEARRLLLLLLGTLLAGWFGRNKDQRRGLAVTGSRFDWLRLGIFRGLARVRGIRTLGRRGAASQGEAEHKNPAKHVSQVSSHVDLCPEQRKGNGWISCKNLFFLSDDPREKLSVYAGSGPGSLHIGPTHFETLIY